MREHGGLLVELWGRAYPGGGLEGSCFDLIS